MTERMLGIIIVVVLLLGAIVLWIGFSYFEMRAFNKFSNQPADLTDAMFSNLRVMAYSKEVK